MPKTIATLSGLDLADVARLAETMVAVMPRHLVIGLAGTLGAGKTSLTQAIAAAAGIDTADVTSPTFTLLQTYQANLKLHHLDAYRVADEDEFLELGVDELFEDPEAWTIVEWADRVADVMPPETLWLKIEIETDERRTITAACDEPEQAERLVAIAEKWTSSSS